MKPSQRYPSLLAVSHARELQLIGVLGGIQATNEQIEKILDTANTEDSEMKLAKIACLVRIIKEQCSKGLAKQ